MLIRLMPACFRRCAAPLVAIHQHDGVVAVTPCSAMNCAVSARLLPPVTRSSIRSARDRLMEAPFDAACAGPSGFERG